MPEFLKKRKEEEGSKANQYYAFSSAGPRNTTLHSLQNVQYPMHMVPERYFNITRRKRAVLLSVLL